MKTHFKPLPFALFLMITFCLNACVTTRQQLNEENGVGNPSGSSQPSQNAVKSEDLAPQPAKPEPATAPAPVTANPPAAAPIQATTPAPHPASNNTVTQGSYTMEEIRAEMAKLNGKVEELEHEKKLREDQRAEEQKKLQDKIAELENQLKENQPKGPAVPEGKTPFQAGKDAYFNERYEEAIGFFDRTLGTKETGKEAEEASYLRGESNFKLKNYQKAIIDYSKFPEKYTKSAYHPKALIRIAESFEAMGMKEDGKIFYQNVADQFPKTAEGKLAKKRLNQKKK